MLILGIISVVGEPNVENLGPMSSVVMEEAAVVGAEGGFDIAPERRGK